MTIQPYLTRGTMSSKSLKVISISTLSDAIAAVTNVVRVFKTDGVLVLRGYKFSIDDQLKFVQSMGDLLDWNVCTAANQATLDSSMYQGGHSDLDRDYSERPDEYLLDWHIEQVYYKYPILAGAWNMTTFTADSEMGNTRFVDATELYETYSELDRDFLSKSIVVWDKPAPGGSGPFYTRAIAPHPITGTPTLRVETDRGCYAMPKLHLFDGKQPSEAQIEHMDKLLNNLKDTLDNDESIRYTQRWQEGDLLIVDLFKMYHAVMGGFTSGQRRFTGIGLRPKEYDNSKYTSIGDL